LVIFVKPINLRDWDIVPYDNILQQTDMYSFSFAVLTLYSNYLCLCSVAVFHVGRM